MRANTILGLCDRFGCLPSQAEKEGASIIRLLKIHNLGSPPQEGGE